MRTRRRSTSVSSELRHISTAGPARSGAAVALPLIGSTTSTLPVGLNCTWAACAVGLLSERVDPGIGVKRYPSCASTHQSLDATLAGNSNLLSVWAAANDRGESDAYLDSYYMTYLSGPYNGWFWIPTNDPTWPAPGAWVTNQTPSEVTLVP